MRPWSKKGPKSTPKEIEFCNCHHSIRLEKTRNLKENNVKIGFKITELCQLECHALKWQLAYFGPKMAIFAKFVLLRIYIKIDRQTK